MSVSLLFTPNLLGPFYLGEVNVALLNVFDLFTNYVDTEVSSPPQTLQLGTVNATTIRIGNATHSSTCDISQCANMILPQTTISPYVISNSGAEVVKNVNLSGAVSTGIAQCRFRRIGNWVDIYVFSNITFVGVTNTDAIKLIGALDAGYRPLGNVSFIIQVIDTGVSPSNVAGTALIDASGDIEIRRLGPVNWTGGADWGFNSFSYSFTIQ